MLKIVLCTLIILSPVQGEWKTATGKRSHASRECSALKGREVVETKGDSGLAKCQIAKCKRARGEKEGKGKK